MLKITLSAGLVGSKETQRRVIRALGLKKYGSCAMHANSPTIQGMISKVKHLVSVVEVKDEVKGKTKQTKQ